MTMGIKIYLIDDQSTHDEGVLGSEDVYHGSGEMEVLFFSLIFFIFFFL